MSESSNRILLRSTLGSLAPPSRGGFGSVRSYLNAFQLICEIQRTRNPTTSAGRWGGNDYKNTYLSRIPPLLKLHGDYKVIFDVAYLTGARCPARLVRGVSK